MMELLVSANGYKASFRECPMRDRKNFFQSTCIMPISVGQPVHEGEKFLSVINLINTSFKGCTILINDTLQRHSMQIGKAKNSDFFYQMALEAGDAWLVRNAHYLKRLTIEYKIMRWDEWLNRTNYKKSLEKVRKYYAECDSYRKHIHANIEDFLGRYLQRLPYPETINYNDAYMLCLEYLLEECAGMCLWVEDHYQFEVYPGGRNKSMAATYECLIKPAYPELLKSVALRFKKVSRQVNIF